MQNPVLIVGQGIAGTLLSWQLHKLGVPFLVVDAGHARSASRIAAGLISPVTGQRFTKTWRIETLLPLALETYRELEAELQTPLLEELDVWRLFSSETERMRWGERHHKGALAPYDLGALDPVEPAAWAHAPFGGCALAGTVRVHLPVLLEAWRRRLRDEDTLVEHALSEGEISATDQGIVWRQKIFRCMIFCTGAEALPFAGKPHVALRRAGGEIAALEVQNWPSSTMLNAGAWFLPAGKGKLLCGASYRPEELPSSEESGAQWLDAEAKRVLRIAWRRTEIFSGWRSITQDKLPVAGWLEGWDERAGIFGGLGSKGAVFAPWLAAQWAELLTRGSAINVAVSPSRSV